MPQNNVDARSPGIRVSVNGTPVGAVYGLKCPELAAEAVDATPLDAGWSVRKPVRKYAGDLRLTMLLKAGDAGQALLAGKYRTAETVTVSLDFPGGQRLAWQGWVSAVALTAVHPDAPVSLEAAVCVSGEAEVSA